MHACTHCIPRAPLTTRPACMHTCAPHPRPGPLVRRAPVVRACMAAARTYCTLARAYVYVRTYVRE
ncbi:NAC domain-containing protein 43 [Zea mays]|uniref:NAC domain-containing protein 43 n=1 Tax=Zea mays TaxID=4577 RepID=A0A1D6NW34_MAIZE|nr:NAC domain-containing protein 43 [Zea mays]